MERVILKDNSEEIVHMFQKTEKIDIIDLIKRQKLQQRDIYQKEKSKKLIHWRRVETKRQNKEK